ncbi:hypothetical protein [Lyngbya aestuarii]|nr:hypothetical protein [Lyngbya aestuarii]
MNNCPCCSTNMLRHIRHSQVYWYCSNCKQEMPNLSDCVKISTILNRFRTHSCQIPMKFADQFPNTPQPQPQEGTVQSILGMGC